VSDIERTKGLLATDDPQVWAEEFCRIFDGHIIGSGEAVDVDIVMRWFTDFAETAERINKARRERIRAATDSIPDAEKEAFVAGFSEGREGEPT
jgi:hypothetical protein